jgi:hypothetical protein
MTGWIHVAFGVAAITWVMWLFLAGRKHGAGGSRLWHDGPTMTTYLVGAWVLWPLGWAWALAYLLVVAACSWWFTTHVCPYCNYHGRKDGPSIYCVMASRLTPREDPARFAAQFRRHLPVMATAWFLPVIGGGWLIWRAWRAGGNAWAMTLWSLGVFAVVAFYIMPTGSKSLCRECANRDQCPHAKQVSRSDDKALPKG